MAQRRSAAPADVAHDPADALLQLIQQRLMHISWQKVRNVAWWRATSFTSEEEINDTLARHQKHALKGGHQVAVHMSQLHLILEIRHRPQAADQDIGLLRARENWPLNH